MTDENEEALPKYLWNVLGTLNFVLSTDFLVTTSELCSTARTINEPFPNGNPFTNHGLNGWFRGFMKRNLQKVKVKL